MSSGEKVREAIKDVIRAVEHWRTTNEPRNVVNWNGRQVKSISDTVIYAVNHLQQQLQDDFPKEDYHTVLSADRFVNRFHDWQDDAITNPEGTDPGGSRKLWEVYDSADVTNHVPVLTKAAEPRLWASEMSPRIYVDTQGVGQRQVAKIMGWYTEDGDPDVSKVNEELQHPGKHFDPETHVTPKDQEREDALAELWEQRKVERQEAATAEAEAAPVTPESLDTLVQLPGMSTRQIRKMLPDVTLEEIQETCELYQVSLTDLPYVAPDRPRTMVEQEAAREEEQQKQREHGEAMAANWYPEIADDEERAIRMYADGLKAAQIFEILVRHQGGEAAPSRERIALWIKNKRRRDERASAKEAAAAE